MTGYSDRINHALAFAAKHLDQQVRKGTRLPYLTAPANVAVILTRYGCDEQIVVAGILRDVVEDCMRDGFSGEVLSQRISEKFGERVLATVLAATPRRNDDDGVELAGDDRRDDFVERLVHASDEARWVVAADLVHGTSALLSDLERTEYPDVVWGRFAAGREGTLRWYRRVHDRLASLGFAAPVMDELRAAVERIEQTPVEEPR